MDQQIQTDNPGPETGAQPTSAIVANGYLGAQFAMTDVLRNVLNFQHPVPNGVLRIGSSTDSGVITIRDGAVITGARMVGSGEWGPTGLAKLLSVQYGSFAYLILSKPSRDVAHEMNVPIADLLAQCQPTSNVAPPVPLAGALKRLLKNQESGAQNESGAITETVPAYVQAPGYETAPDYETVEPIKLGPMVSPEDASTASQKLRLAAILGVDLVTAGQHLKKLSPGQIKELSAGELDSDKVLEAIGQAPEADVDANDDDTADEAIEVKPAANPTKGTNWAETAGAILAVCLLVAFGYQCMQAFAFRDHLHAGLVALNKSKLDVAQVEFSKSISANPARSESYFCRALTEMESGDNDAALRDCSSAIQLNPNNIDYFLARASLYSKMKDYPKAIDDCNIATKLISVE